jgi:energy-coupling factor transporter ATP-binding protein EcfA2
VPGISGGERRRLAIASETLCLRAGGVTGSRGGFGGGVILADEPTTGLDAHQAEAYTRPHFGSM